MNRRISRIPWIPDCAIDWRRLFTVATSSADQGRVAVYSFDDGEVRTLFPGVTARYAASGHIIYAAFDGSLMAAPFDPAEVDVTGPPVGLPERVSLHSETASAEFAVPTADQSSRPL